jgi:hypothetical protein
MVYGDCKVQWSNIQIPSEMDFTKYILKSCMWNIEMWWWWWCSVICILNVTVSLVVR